MSASTCRPGPVLVEHERGDDEDDEEEIEFQPTWDAAGASDDETEDEPEV